MSVMTCQNGGERRTGWIEENPKISERPVQCCLMRQIANKLSPLTVVCANDVSSSKDLWILDSVIRLTDVIQAKQVWFSCFLSTRGLQGPNISYWNPWFLSRWMFWYHWQYSLFSYFPLTWWICISPIECFLSFTHFYLSREALLFIPGPNLDRNFCLYSSLEELKHADILTRNFMEK